MLELILFFSLHAIAVGLMQGLAAFLPPWLSLSLAWLTLWLLPGFMLWRMVSFSSPTHWFYTLPFAFNLGLAWLMAWVMIVFFFFPFDLTHLNFVIIIANTSLAIGYFGVKYRYKTSSIFLDIPQTSALLLTGTLLTLITLLGVSIQAQGFTFEGDEWSYLVNIRYFLATPAINADYFAHTLELDLWNFLLAFLLQFAPNHLFELYGLYLPALFLITTCLAYLSLADTLFENPNIAYFALIIQGLYWLSSVNLLTADNGLGLLARILQDKFSAFFLVLPLIQLCSLKFLQSYQPKFFIMGAVFAIAAVLIHPIAIMWLLFSIGGTLLFVIWQHRHRFHISPQWVGLAFTFLALATGLAWWQRSIRPEHYFTTSVTIDGNAHALALSAGRVLFLSMEHSIYLAHPNMLTHPFIIVALLLTLTLIPHLKTKLTAQYLFANSFWVLVILFNPITASILGRIISFWIIYRIVWILPTSLILAYIFYPLLEQGTTYFNHRWVKTPQLAGLTLALIALSLSGRIFTSIQTLNAWQPFTITPTELDISQQIAHICLPNLVILAPHEVNIHLTSTAPQVHPMTARLYGSADPKLLDVHYFLNSTWLHESLYSDLLPRYQVTYLLTRQSDPIESQLRLFPHLFTLRYANTEYSLYEWQAAAASSLELMLFHTNGLIHSQPTQAQNLYESILQQKSGYLPAILGLSYIYEQQLQFDQAIALYQTAQPQTRFEQALLLTRLTQAQYLAEPQPIPASTMNNFIQSYRQALELADGHEAVYQAVLANYQTLNQTARQSLAGQALRYALLEFYETQAAAAPNDFRQQQKLAYIYQQVGETDLALTQYTTLTQQFPEQLEPYFAQADIFQARKDDDLALQSYHQALAHETEPMSGRANLRLAQFHRQQHNKSLATYYAQQALTTGQADMMGAAYLELGHLALNKNNLNDALDQFLNAIEIQPNNPSGYVELGHIYSQQNDPETALEYYHKAITYAPNSAYYRLVLAEALLKTGQRDLGQVELAQALQLEPASSSVYQQIGALKLQYLSFEEALSDLHHALKLDPTNGQVYLTLAQSHRQRGEWRQAHEVIQQALTAVNHNDILSQIYTEQGQVYLGQQNKEAALKSFLTALDLTPRNPWIYGLIGDFYQYQQIDLAQAEFYYRQALLFSPPLSWVQVSLGEVLLELGQKEAATVELSQVMRREATTSETAKRVRQLAKQYQISALY